MSDTSKGLSVTRYIAAPPAKVWKVMTDRQEEWWCPMCRFRPKPNRRSG